jgi:MFS family permease
MKHARWVFAAIMLAHVGLSLLFNAATPIFEAPDEDGHYLFVRYLQVYHTLPVQTLDPDGPRAHHPPLYHVLAALITAWVPVRAGADRVDMQINPKVWFRYDDPELDNKAKWVHYGPEERWPYSGQALVVHLGRLLSLAFSCLGVIFTYLAARELRPGGEGKMLALLAAAVVALNPMVLFMSAVLQNNTTMLAAGGSVLYALTLGLRRGFDWRRWALLGGLLGLGLLLQLSSLVLAAPIGVVMLYETWRSRRTQTLIGGGLAVALPFVALTGWWFWRNQVLYSDWTGNSVVAKMWCCDVISPAAALKLFLTGLLGRFGQGLMITYPYAIYWLATLVVAVAMVGLAWPWLRRRRDGGPVAHGTETWLWLLHTVMIASVFGALLFYAVTVAPGLPGRYVFPAFPSLAAVLGAGWLSWFGARRRWLGALALAGLTLAASLYALYGLLIPTYRMPPTASAAQLSAMTRVDANIGDTAQVLGYRLDQTVVRPGDTLELTLYWQPLSQTDVPYTVFLHLLDPADGPIAQRDTYPGLGNYATTIWDVGRPIVDTYRLKVPDDSAAGTYPLVFGLYEGGSGVRLPVTGRDAGPAENAWVRLGSIQIAP